MQLVVEGIQPLRSCYLGVRSTIRDIKSIDRRSALGTDPSECDVDFIPAEALQQIMEQSDSIRRLDFDQGEIWIGLVVDADMRGEFQIRYGRATSLFSRLFQQRTQIGRFAL